MQLKNNPKHHVLYGGKVDYFGVKDYNLTLIPGTPEWKYYKRHNLKPYFELFTAETLIKFPDLLLPTTKYILKVSIPDFAEVCVTEREYIRSNKIVIDGWCLVDEFYILWNNKEFCEKIVKINGLFLQHCGYQIKKCEKIQMAAIIQNPMAIQYVIDISDNLSVFAEAVRRNNKILYLIGGEKSVDFLSKIIDEVGITNIKINYTNAASLPSEIIAKFISAGILDFKKMKCQDYNICMAAIEKNPKNLKYVKNEDVLSSDTVAQFISDGVFDFKKMKYQDEYICIRAVEKNPKNLKYVKNKTLDICRTAYNLDERVYKYMTRDMQLYFKYNNNNIPISKLPK